MDKQILQDYIDACALIRETEADIRALRQKRKTIIQTNVKGSNPEFPYQEQHFKIQGMAFTYRDDSQLRKEEELLDQRKARAEESKNHVAQWMLTVPARMHRVIRFKYFQGMSWEEVAAQMGRKATADSVKMEFRRFMEQN